MYQRNHLALRSFVIPWIAIGAVGFAQSASTTPVSNEDATVLSVFKVSSTEDKGYIATSATPFKTKQALVDIPQSIIVVTRDLLDDIGGTNTSDIIIYAGAIPKYRSEAFSLRGSNTGVTYPLIDGQIDRTIFMDSLFVDSYEVIKGPAALLYPNSALTGVINKTTRRPLPTAQHSVKASITDFGLYRAEFDSTGPVGEIRGGAKLSYRLLAAYQDGDAYWRNAEDKRILIHPSLQLDYKKTSVLLAYDYQQITRPSNPSGVLMTNGRPFTGAGRDELNLPPGAMEKHEHNGARAQVVHAFSDGWEVKVGGDVNQLYRVGSIVLPISGVNYANRTLSFFNRKNDIELNHYSLSIDVNGRYELGGLKNQSTFGLALTDQESLTKLWVNTNFYNGITVDRIIRPLDKPDVDTLPVKPVGQYTGNATTGTKVRADLGNFYFQQSIDVIRDRLSLVAGVAKYSNETSNITNLYVRPLVAQISKSDEVLHRYGLVFHLSKEVTVYAMDANTSLPPTTSVLANGGIVPPATGKGKEAGLKLNLLDGKFTFSISAFKLETTGLTVFGGTNAAGAPFVIPVGTLTQKGYDGDLTFRITRQWQVVGTFFKGTVKDQNNLPVDDAYTGSWSLFTRYEFANDSLKGFGIGGGASRITGRVSSTNGVTYPVGQTKPLFIDVEPATLVGAFVTYTVNKNWSLRLQGDNLLDKVYAVGINAAYLVDTSLPRNFTFSAKYKF